MALWLVRAGAHGEFEQKFLDEKRIYLTWDELNINLKEITEWEDLKSKLTELYPNNSKNLISNNAGQIWAFYNRIKRGDWIALPSKYNPSINIGEVTSEYKFNQKAEDPYKHYREIKWIENDIPRSNFDQDILYSLGAFMTVCQISRNNAEDRVKAMAKNNWKSVPTKHTIKQDEESDESKGILIDLELTAKDQIAKFIIAKYKGHGLARLVDGILRAEGYVTHLSPEGPDKGIDILAGTGSLGFGSPKICVQVKSEESPIDRQTLDQLIGTMQNVNADQGLLVSWGGFKSTVTKEKANQFFRVRLWDQKNLIEKLLKYYDKLDDEIQAELPLKRIWVIPSSEIEQKV